MSLQYDANGNLIDGTQITSRKTQTTQTQNAVSIVTAGFSNSSTWVDCSGYSDLSITVMNDAATASSGNILWSNDGVTTQGQDNAVAPNNSSAQKAGTTKIKARYAKVQLSNTDAATHTMSAWIYLST